MIRTNDHDLNRWSSVCRSKGDRDVDRIRLDRFDQSSGLTRDS